MPRIKGFHPSHKPVSRAHGDAAHRIAADMLHDFRRQMDMDVLGRIPVNFNGIENCRQGSFRKLNVDNRSHDLHNLADMTFFFSG